MMPFLYSFVGIFVAMDIIGVLPLYLSITKSMSAQARRKIVGQSVLVAALVAFSFAVVGKSIFRFLGVAIYDFQVGGGIVLLVMAILDLIRGKDGEEHSGATGVVPLGVPLITGPALITTVTLQVALYGHFVVFAGMLANFLFAYLALNKSSLITRYIGKEGTDIFSKIAALLMTAIAFAMIRSGIIDAVREVYSFLGKICPLA